MLSFPLNLCPSRIKIVQLPATQRAQGLSQDGLIDVSISLSDVPTQGTLDFMFESYPVKPRLLPGYGSSITPGTNCGLDQAGWNGAWDFYRQTKDGHLPFILPDAHPLWQRIEFQNEWFDNSIGRQSVYRIIEPPLLSHPEGIQQRGAFNLRIRQSLRTPRHV
jgi:hypothetical protein